MVAGRTPGYKYPQEMRPLLFCIENTGVCQVRKLRRRREGAAHRPRSIGGSQVIKRRDIPKIFLLFPNYKSIYRNLRSFRRTDILKSSHSLAFSMSSNVGNKEPSPVELLDLFPTLADLAGLPPVPLCPKDSEKVLMENKNYAQFVVKK